MGDAARKPGWQPFKPTPKRNLCPDSAQKILSYTLKRYGIDKDIARYNFVLHWEEIVGEEISKRATPECIQGSCLIVKVKDSVWAQELSFQKEVIIRRLNRRIESSVEIDDVHFYVSG